MGLQAPPAPPRRQDTISPATARPTWRMRMARFDVKVSPYLYITPFFVLFAIFGLYPLVYTFWVSLHDWELIGDQTLVGVANYAVLFQDALFWNSVVNTLGMFVLATVPQLLLALVLANALNRRLRARTLLRMGILVPMVTSVAAVTIVFSQLFGRDFGMINWLLGFVGVENIDFKAHRWSSWIAISTMTDWRWTGYNALIYLAAMQSIPRDLYEAAALDGASAIRQFWRITVPLLRPAIIFTVIISTIGGMQLFTEPVMFDVGDVDGGDLGQFQTMTMYMFENAFRVFDYGYASAIAWTLFVLIFVFSIINFLIVRRIGGSQ